MKRTDTDGLPTPLGVNHTAGFPAADISYSQDNSRSPARSLATVSPTEPWSNIQNVPEDNHTAGRQMPLRRRTCDKQTTALAIQSSAKNGMIPKQDVSSKVSQETDDLKKKGVVDALSEKSAALSQQCQKTERIELAKKTLLNREMVRTVHMMWLDTHQYLLLPPTKVTN